MATAGGRKLEGGPTHRHVTEPGPLHRSTRYDAYDLASARADADGNTYQSRRLEHGSDHEIVKNFPSAAEVRAVIAAGGGRTIGVSEFTYYWCATYELAGES